MAPLLALMLAADLPEPDDPGLARLVRQAPHLHRERPGGPDPPPPLFRVGLGFGSSSPLIDPDVHEGFGGSVDLALGRRLSIELRSSVAYQRYVEPLDNLGVQFVSGDITLGPGYAFLPSRNWRVHLFGGVGPAWMTTWIWINWSLGVMGGLGVEWTPRPWFGIRAETRYHLFHLHDIGGEPFRDRRSLREVGPVDRLDLPVGVVFRL